MGAAVLVTVATVVSKLLGFARETAIAAVFGASAEVDAYLVAQSVPNVLIALLSTAVVTSMLPSISGDLADGRPDRAIRTFNTIATLVIGLLIPATVILWFGAPAVIAVLAPGFEGAQADLAARLARIVLLAVTVVAATNLVSALLHAHRRFAWPALEGLPFNIVMIGAALLFGVEFGIDALAIGFVVGSLARLALALTGLIGTGSRIRPGWAIRSVGVRATGGLVPTVVTSHVISNINNVVDRVVGSTLQAGAISALGFGHRLVSLPQGLLTQALVTVVFPSMSASLATGDPEQASRLLRQAIRALSVILTPVVVVLMIQSQELATVVFGRGAFDAEDARLTALAIIAFAPGLLVSGIRDLALRGLYAAKDRRRPLIVAAVGGVTNVVGDITLGPTVGVAGLAAATSLSQGVSAAVAVHATGVARGVRSVVTAAAAALAASAALSAMLGALTARALEGVVPSLISLLAAVAVVTAVHIAVLLVGRPSLLRDLPLLGSLDRVSDR